MKTCVQMQTAIEALAQKHGVDLSQSGNLLVLDMLHYMRLYIEVFAPRRIVVAHYFEVNGDSVPDPRMTFFVTEANEWAPIGITQTIGGPTSYVKMTEDGLGIAAYDTEGQADLTDFAATWATNLVDQKWLEHATCIRSFTAPVTKSNSRWLEPITETPDMDTLLEWLLMDGDCEATDGCLIEPDGVCHHGYPSWLLQLGMI